MLKLEPIGMMIYSEALSSSAASMENKFQQVNVRIIYCFTSLSEEKMLLYSEMDPQTLQIM